MQVKCKIQGFGKLLNIMETKIQVRADGPLFVPLWRDLILTGFFSKFRVNIYDPCDMTCNRTFSTIIKCDSQVRYKVLHYISCCIPDSTKCCRRHKLINLVCYIGTSVNVAPCPTNDDLLLFSSTMIVSLRFLVHHFKRVTEPSH